MAKLQSSWPKESAGSYLTTRIPIAQTTWSVDQTKEYLTSNIFKFDTINYIYLTNQQQQLKGVISIRELHRHSGLSSILSIAVFKGDGVVTVGPKTDQEVVARKALRSGVKAMPVVSKDKEFLGVVPTEAILSILDKETHEDFLRMSGTLTSNRNYADPLSIPVLAATKSRLPWLLIGLLGGLLAAQIIIGFEAVLAEYLILAFFIPLVVYISNAVGAQTQTMVIRNMAILKTFSLSLYFVKELIISSIIGLVCGAAVLGLVGLFWGDMMSAIAIGISTFMTIIAAVFVGMLVPYIFYLLKKDPALASGPFATIIQDIISVLIYFSVATLIL